MATLAPPCLQLRLVGIHAREFVVRLAMNRQALVLLPALNGAHVLLQEGGNFLPGVELLTLRFPGRSIVAHETSRRQNSPRQHHALADPHPGWPDERHIATKDGKGCSSRVAVSSVSRLQPTLRLTSGRSNAPPREEQKCCKLPHRLESEWTRARLTFAVAALSRCGCYSGCSCCGLLDRCSSHF